MTAIGRRGLLVTALAAPAIARFEDVQAQSAWKPEKPITIYNPWLPAVWRMCICASSASG